MAVVQRFQKLRLGFLGVLGNQGERCLHQCGMCLQVLNQAVIVNGNVVDNDDHCEIESISGHEIVCIVVQQALVELSKGERDR